MSANRGQYNQFNQQEEGILTNLAHGSIRRGMKLESGDIRSRNYISGSQGWRLTPTEIELGIDAGVGAVSSWTPTWGGFSANPTGVVARAALMFNVAHLWIYMGATGTSNSQAFYIDSIPYPVSAALGDITFPLMPVIDNGTVAWGSPSFVTGNRTRLYMYEGAGMRGGTTWVNSGAKGFLSLYVCYPVD